MYLARKKTGFRHVGYILRESYQSGGVFLSRDLADLGRDPGRLIVYSGGSSFHIDEEFVRRLREQGVTAPYSELEALLFPFVDPYIQQRLEPFRNRGQYRAWRPASETLRTRAMRETQPMDRRRLHYLRMGRTSPETVDKTAAFYTVLLDKSRDEIEQLIHDREQALPPREYHSYLFAIFNLQRFFKESYARSIPQALDRDRLDSLFIEEICRVAGDGEFWRGYPRTDRLPDCLIRYLIMYFDAAPDEPLAWMRFARSSRTRRFHSGGLATADKMSRTQAFALFGLSGEQLAGMRKKDLTRLYRQKAHELHPDKGGDSEQFIRLTAAYEELLPSLRS